jgi:hypothetical protein
LFSQEIKLASIQKLAKKELSYYLKRNTGKRFVEIATPDHCK